MSTLGDRFFQAWKTRSAPTPPSTFLDSARRWTPARPCNSRPSHTQATDTRAPWDHPLAIPPTLPPTAAPDLNPWYVSIRLFLRSPSTTILFDPQPRQNGRYSRVPSQGGGSGTHNVFSPEYDDPANCAPEEDQYGSQYGQYGAPYDHYGSRGSVGRRSVGSARNIPVSGSPEPPPPPPRNHDQNNSSFNDSKESNEISEAECDRDQLVNRNYGGQYKDPVIEPGDRSGTNRRTSPSLSLAPPRGMELPVSPREQREAREAAFRSGSPFAPLLVL